MRIALVGLSGRPAGVIQWDPETGDLAGEPAEGLRTLAEAARREGWISVAPQPAVIEATDPIADPAQFAALVATAYQLPDELVPFYPSPEDDQDDSGIEWTY